MDAHKTNSTDHAPLFSRIQENLQFFAMRLNGIRQKDEEVDRLLNQIDDFSDTYESITGKSFGEARILEIGYGAL